MIVDKKIFTEIAGGIRKSTWDNYDIDERRGYAKSHPHTKYAKEFFEKKMIDAEMGGFCIILNKEKVLCTYNEETCYQIRNVLRKALYTKEEYSDYFVYLIQAKGLADWVEPFESKRLTKSGKDKIYTSKLGDRHLFVMGEFEID